MQYRVSFWRVVAKCQQFVLHRSWIEAKASRMESSVDLTPPACTPISNSWAGDRVTMNGGALPFAIIPSQAVVLLKPLKRV